MPVEGMTDIVFNQGVVAQGELLHTVLERLIYRDSPRQAPNDETITRRFNATDVTQVGAIRATDAMRRMLSVEALAYVFSPIHLDVARDGIEFSGRDGTLLYVNRLIERDNEVPMIDYKLRLLPVERVACTDQLRSYVAAVIPMYPGRTARAGAATAQEKWIDLEALPKSVQALHDGSQDALF